VKERQVLDEKYVVIRQLGSGPTGTLYEGENLILGNRVAIKVIDPALARRTASYARRERRQTSTIRTLPACSTSASLTARPTS
jgi:serine/threonine protein kinase